MSLLHKTPQYVKLEESMQEQLKNHLDEEKLFTVAEFDESSVEKIGYSNYSYWRSTFQVFARNKVAMFLVFLVLAILIFTFIQPVLPNQHDPIETFNAANGMPMRNVTPGEVEGFPLGTNAIGQDLWARLWAATRNSLIIAIAVACIEAVVGILAGVLWGYVKACDIIFTELYNLLDNIPSSLVLILVSYMLTPGIGTIIFAMSITRWIGMARFIRNQIVIIRDREYNLASRCLGTGTFKIIFRNLLPYLVSVIMMRFALAIPEAIGSEVFITYIGLGLPATTPSLGNLINVGRQLMMSPNLRYQLIYPTIILSIVTVAFYVIGNSFSDAADPKNHR